MDCDDCDMHDLCIPVPGMPGQCTLPAKCEQCIGDRMDVVEAGSAAIDADLAAMRADIDAMVAGMDGISRAIEEQTREIDGIKKGVAIVIDGSAILLRRAGTSAATSSAMLARIEQLKKMVIGIKAEVL